MIMNSTELNINLKALRRVDPCIMEIVAHSSQVALYKFSSGKGDWDKTEVEGTLFVYQREAEPHYGFTIMNRLNMDNLVEPVTKELDFQLQTPFLLYRNHTGSIYGIWFYEQAECEEVGKKIEELVKEVEELSIQPSQQNISQGPGKKGGKLGQLFSKATSSHVEKETSEPPQPLEQDKGRNLLRLLSQPDPVAPAAPPVTETRPNTTASVKDFFALASSTQQGGPSTSPGLSGGPSAFTSTNPGGQGKAAGPPPPLLGTVPGGGGVINQPTTITAMPISQGLAMGAVPVAGQFSGLYPGVDQQTAPPLLGGPHTVPPLVGGVHTAPGLLGGVQTAPPLLGGIHAAPPLPGGAYNAPPLLGGVHSVESLEAEQRASSRSPGSGGPVRSGMSDLETQLKKSLQIGGGTSKPTLLSPQAFTSTGPMVTNGRSPLATNGRSFLATNGRGESPPSTPITPLTQQQMVEAVTFMLEHDEDFVTKLHQAYVMSINKKFKSSQVK